MSDSSIIFVKLPSQEHFCHVIVKATSEKFNFHLQVLKCRQLLQVCPNVISAPQINEKTLIDVVMQVEFYKSKFGAFCHKLQLKPIQATHARNFVLERCIIYTLKFRLSPQWNQVGSVLVCNKEFLSCHGRMEAVNFEATVRESELTLKVKPYLIRTPPARLECFGICPEALDKFRDDKDYVIPESAINLEWCHILPTMNKGQVVNISHEMPCDGGSRTLLKDYAGMKGYWKSLYGYHLPERLEDVVYCSVLFKQISFNCFTYPLVCLRNRPIQFMPRCDGQAIKKNFMKDVRQSFSSLCGLPLTYSGVTCIPAVSLSVSSKVRTGTPQTITICGKVKEGRETKDAKVPNLDIIPPTQDVTSNNASSSHVVPSLDKKLNQSALKASGFPITTEGKFIPVFQRKHITQEQEVPKIARPKPLKKRVENLKTATNEKQVKKSANNTLQPPTASSKMESSANLDPRQTTIPFNLSRKTSALRVVTNTPRNSNKAKNPSLNALAKETLPSSSTKLAGKHKFDQLFSCASSSEPPLDHSDVSTTCLQTGSCESRASTKQQLSDDQTCAKPGGGAASTVPSMNNMMQTNHRLAGTSASLGGKLPQKHKFDDLFSKTSLSNAADKPSKPSCTKARVKVTPRKKGKFDDMFKPASIS